MARDFLILMGGLLFALIDIDLHRFVLLPDFVGYALIAFASHNLSQYAPRFEVARNLALPLLALSLLVYLIPAGIAASLLLVNAFLTILLVWFLLGALIQFADERERPDLASYALIYRRIYVGIAAVAFLLQWAALSWPEEAGAFLGIMAVATLLVLALILRLLYVVKHDLAVDATIPQ